MAILVDDVLGMEPGASWDTLHLLLRRARLMARLARRSRARRKCLRMLRAEISDPRLLADMGVDADVVCSYRATRAMARAMGGF